MTEKVIFLDVDGVLAPWDTGELDERCVGRLQRLVDHTGARLVLTSSWREHSPLDEIGQQLAGAGLRAPLHDSTPIDIAGGRPAEITRWIDAAHPLQFVILDDELIRGHEHRQVKTNEYDGFTAKDLAAAHALFAS